MTATAMPSESGQQKQGEGTSSAALPADSSSQHQIEDLQRREAALDAIFNATAHGILVYNGRGEIVRMNSAAMAMLECSPADLRQPIPAQTQLFRLLLPDGQPLTAAQSPILRALQGDTIAGALIILERRDGSRLWLSVSAAPLQAGATGSGAVVSFADITSQQEAREQKEDLLRAVSHDLRNPLAALRLHARVLLANLALMDDASELLEHAEAILTSSGVMETMIKGMVDAARLESGQLKLDPETFEIRAFVSNLLHQQGDALSAHRIRLAPGEEMPVVADVNCVERIMVNLLSNAVKYSAPDTEVTVTIARQPGVIVVAVGDRGRGMSRDDLRCLFRRYFRASNCGEESGLGLGLYITQMLVAAQGGRIWAESVLGEGSTFSFTLPSA